MLVLTEKEGECQGRGVSMTEKEISKIFSDRLFEKCLQNNLPQEKKLKEKVCQSGKSQSEFILDMLNL